MFLWGYQKDKNKANLTAVVVWRSVKQLAALFLVLLMATIATFSAAAAAVAESFVWRRPSLMNMLSTSQRALDRPSYALNQIVSSSTGLRHAAHLHPSDTIVYAARTMVQPVVAGWFIARPAAPGHGRAGVGRAIRAGTHGRAEFVSKVVRPPCKVGVDARPVWRPSIRPSVRRWSGIYRWYTLRCQGLGESATRQSLSTRSSLAGNLRSAAAVLVFDKNSPQQF